MIIITHKRDHIAIDCDCSLANSFNCLGNDDTCYLSMNYLKGKDQPNYPVPAIINPILTDWFDYWYECWLSNNYPS